MRIKLSYTGPDGKSMYVAWDSDEPVDQTLEKIGQIVSTGGLYVVFNQGKIVMAIPGRRIELVEVTES